MKRISGVERKYEVYSLKNETAPSNLMLKPSLVLKDMRLENEERPPVLHWNIRMGAFRGTFRTSKLLKKF